MARREKFPGVRVGDLDDDHLREITAARFGEESSQTRIVWAGAVEDEVDGGDLEKRCGGEQQRHAEGLGLKARSEGADGMAGVVEKDVVVEKLAKTPEVERSDGSRGRFGAVIIVLEAEEEGGVAVGGGKIAAARLVPEMEVEGVLELPRPAEPAAIEVGGVEIEEAAERKT